MTSIEYSVAINAYNREAEIGETLEAVLSQNMPAAEIVVVDDGSTDATAGVVARFGDRVRYSRIDNVGPGQSRHLAVSRCRFPWVATCDSDDLWEPFHVESMCAALGAFPDASLVFTNSTRFGPCENGDYDHFESIPVAWWNEATETRDGHCRLLRTDAYRHLLDRNPVYVSCSMFRSSLYVEIGGAHPPLSRVKSEDSDLTRRLALAGRLACSDRVSVRIRKHPGNFSESLSANLLGKHRILTRHAAELPLSRELASAVERERDRTLARAFRHACWEDDLDRARECLALVGRGQVTLRDRVRFVRLAISRALGDRRRERAG